MPNCKERGFGSFVILCSSLIRLVIRHSSFLDVESLSVSSENCKNKTHVPHRCEPV